MKGIVGYVFLLLMCGVQAAVGDSLRSFELLQVSLPLTVVVTHGQKPIAGIEVRVDPELSTEAVFTADWRASSGNQWVVPMGGGVGRIMKVGTQPVNLLAQLYGNVVHPSGASPWGMRLQIQFLFPKFTKEQEKMMLEKRLKQLEQEQPQKK